MSLDNLSFKIAMSRLASIRRHPKLTFCITFFQSYMLPLFFSGLLSYLLGMKRRTSWCLKCKKDDSHFLDYLKNPSIMPLGVFLGFLTSPEEHMLWTLIRSASLRRFWWIPIVCLQREIRKISIHFRWIKGTLSDAMGTLVLQPNTHIPLCWEWSACWSLPPVL